MTSERYWYCEDAPPGQQLPVGQWRARQRFGVLVAPRDGNGRFGRRAEPHHA